MEYCILNAATQNFDQTLEQAHQKPDESAQYMKSRQDFFSSFEQLAKSSHLMRSK